MDIKLIVYLHYNKLYLIFIQYNKYSVKYKVKSYYYDVEVDLNECKGVFYLLYKYEKL